VLCAVCIFCIFNFLVHFIHMCLPVPLVCASLGAATLHVAVPPPLGE
jgi:hypothetical protein